MALAPDAPYAPLWPEDSDDDGTPSLRSDDSAWSAEADCDSPCSATAERLADDVPSAERDKLTPPLRITGGSDALERTGGGKVRLIAAGLDGDTACATSGGKLSGGTTCGRIHSRSCG